MQHSSLPAEEGYQGAGVAVGRVRVELSYNRAEQVLSVLVQQIRDLVSSHVTSDATCGPSSDLVLAPPFALPSFLVRAVTLPIPM